MSVLGLGVDIIEIDRMQSVLERTPSFRTRIFSESEREYCDGKARPEVHYALRFAAKEAVLKALGNGFTGMRATDVEVAHDKKGKPIAVLHGSAAKLAQEQGVIEMHLSLSYTHNVGVANAVAVTADSRPKVDEKADSRAELAAAFKEARSLLDELDLRPSEADESDVAETSAGESDAAEPATVEPDTDTAETGAVEPNTVELAAVEPDAAEPDTTEPDTTEPATVEPDTVETSTGGEDA